MAFPKHFLPIAALCIAVLCAPAAWAQPADSQEKEALVNNMANTVLCILKDQKKSAADRESLLQRGFANVVDIDWIAQFVLGSAWKTATPEQQQRYTELYRASLTNSYISNYAENSERRILDIKPLGIVDSESGTFTARTEIVLSGSERLKVDYLVGKKDGGYKIRDVIIENVSLLATHREQFREIAAERGVTAVIAKLEQLVHPEKQPITLSMK